MSVFEELFPTYNDGGMPNRADFGIVRAICALADEVRALRIEYVQKKFEELTLAATKLNPPLSDVPPNLNYGTPRPEDPAPPQHFPLPFVTQAKSERIQYPYCEACESFHHPDDFLCKRLRPQPPAEQEESKS